jgi:hypothetical protein
MKMPFRFHRGEFSKGIYLYTLFRTPNRYAREIIDELVYQITFQWLLEDQATKNKEAVREEYIYDIGKTAGVFQLLYDGDINLGSVGFTRSHVVNGKQRSERGLMDMPNETYRFVRTEYDTYADDIINEASVSRRIGYVPAGTVPVGYVRYDTPLYREDGTIIAENILSEPPGDLVPYAPFYGEKYLVHEHLYKGISPLVVSIFKSLFENFMLIRYNGPSIKTFLNLTSLLGGGYIHDIFIELQGLYYTCYYSLNEEIDILYRTWRLSSWKNVCAQKFKHFVLIQRT